MVKGGAGCRRGIFEPDAQGNVNLASAIRFQASAAAPVWHSARPVLWL